MSLKNCMIILKLYAEDSGLGINLEKKSCVDRVGKI